MWDFFEIEGGIRDKTGQKGQVNMTSALCFMDRL